MVVVITTMSLVGRQLFNFVRDHFGRSFIAVAIWCGFALGAYLLVRTAGRPKRLSIFLVGVAIGVVAATFLDLPEERIHLLLFGALGILLLGDFGVDRLLPALGWGVAFSVLDEFVQGCLPYRVGELRDALINLLSVLWGILLWWGWGAAAPKSVTAPAAAGSPTAEIKPAPQNTTPLLS
jgi:hypothetical protein